MNGEIIVKVEHRLESRICCLGGKVLYSKKEDLEAFDAAISTENNEMVLALATSNVNHPVEVFTMTPGNSAIVQLSNHGSAFEDFKVGTCSYLSCLSTDEKVELDSIYLAPAMYITEKDNAASKQPMPTLVMIHGGPNTRLTNAFNVCYYMLAQFLLHLGYGILLPNYRGSRGRGEQFTSYAIGGTGFYD